MSEEQNVQQLLRDGIEAARAGDKATARTRFEEVVELDENNEKGWMWLASVVETDEEKRVCLSNVLVINPNNEKAQKLMDKLQAKKREEDAQEEVIPGVSRRQLMLIGGGGAAVVILLIAVFLTITISNNSRAAAEAALVARLVSEQTATSAAIAIQQTSNVETQIALAGTDTPTPRSLQLQPTWTPTSTVTPPAAEAVIETPPPAVPGTMVIWGGRDRLSNGALEFFFLPANGSAQATKIGEEFGRDIRYAATTQRVIYTVYDAALFTFGLEAINLNGTQRQPIRPAMPDKPIFEVAQPDYCSTANRVAHIGIPQETLSQDNIQFGNDSPPTKLFITDMDANATIQVSNDAATYIYPAFSPDCTRIAVVRNDENSINAGWDIVVIDIANGTQTPVTTDLTAFSEISPRWSADGTQIIFAAAQASTPNNYDIAITQSDGTGTPILLARDEFNTIFPLIGPNSEYISYSSNRNGTYQIYIQSLADSTVWQLTNLNGDFYPGDWRQ